MNKKLTKTLQSYCDRLNQYLPCKSQEDVDNLNDILSELFKKVNGSELYYSRKMYIDSGFDFEKCGWLISHKDVYFVPVNDVEEHIGVKAMYRYEEE